MFEKELSMGYNVAVLGATGAVGREMIKTLEQRNFPVENLILLASERSKGVDLKFKGEDVIVRTPDENGECFRGVDIGLFSAGGVVSKKFAPLAAKRGCIVIDNTSAFRMQKDVPLVVPEVNAHRIKENKGIIANPNCSTIQMVVALNPLHKEFRLRRIVVTTFQSVSGAGGRAMRELLDETLKIIKSNSSDVILKDRDKLKSIFPHQIAFNVIPQIPQKDPYLEDGYTIEEHKMMDETRKIIEDDRIEISATCVRVPVLIAHSESINAEFEKVVTVGRVIEILSKASGVVLTDDPVKSYPMPINCAGRDEVFVGRIRKDLNRNCIDMWIVSDNLRKGAALNAVQIAELLR